MGLQGAAPEYDAGDIVVAQRDLEADVETYRGTDKVTIKKGLLLRIEGPPCVFGDYYVTKVDPLTLGERDMVKGWCERGFAKAEDVVKNTEPSAVEKLRTSKNPVDVMKAIHLSPGNLGYPK